MNLRHQLALVIILSFVFPLSTLAVTLSTCSGAAIPATITAGFVDYYTYWTRESILASDGGMLMAFCAGGVMRGFCITKFTEKAKIAWRHFVSFAQLPYSASKLTINEDKDNGKIYVTSYYSSSGYSYALSVFDSQTGEQVGTPYIFSASANARAYSFILSNGYYYLYIADSSTKIATMYMAATNDYMWSYNTYSPSVLYTYGSLSSPLKLYFTTDNIQSLGRPSADGTRVPIAFYNSASKNYYVQWGSLSDSCLIPTTFTSTQPLTSSTIDAIYIVSHKDISNVWLYGSTTYDTGYHGWVAKIEEVAAVSGSPLYFNQALATVSNCHSFCPNGCFKEASTEHCVAEASSDSSILVFFGMIRPRYTESIFQGETRKMILTADCYSSCAEMCTTTADNTACTPYCNVSDSSVDESLSSLGICPCSAPYVMSTNYPHHCVQNDCDASCVNDECGPVKTDCLECKWGFYETAVLPYYKKCSCYNNGVYDSDKKVCVQTEKCSSLCSEKSCPGDGTLCFACSSDSNVVATPSDSYFKCECKSGFSVDSSGVCTIVCDSWKVAYNNVCYDPITTGCSALCGTSGCIEEANSAMCIDGCNTAATVRISEVKGRIYSCSCKAGTTQATGSGICLYTSSDCHAKCDGTCTVKNSFLNCGACRCSGGIQSSTLDYVCLCDADQVFDGTNCLPKVSDCHPFCNDCVTSNDNTRCASCSTSLANLVHSGTAVLTCSCDANSEALGNRCILTSTTNCNEFCGGRCEKASDSTACYGSCRSNAVSVLQANTLYACGPCESNYVNYQHVCTLKLIDVCHGLCDGSCTIAANGNYCVGCKNAKNIDIAANDILYKCSCTSGTTYDSATGLCVYTSSTDCGDYCNGKCTVKADNDYCAACLTGGASTGMQTTGETKCNGCVPGKIFNTDTKTCETILTTDCHKLCDDRCTTAGDYTACVGCKSIQNIVATNNNGLMKCECQSGTTLDSGLCVYTSFSDCGDYCNGKCTVKADNAFCASCLTGGKSSGLQATGETICIGCADGRWWDPDEKVCLQIFTENCYELCADGCIGQRDPTRCVACKNIDNIQVQAGTYNQKTCSCASGTTLENGFCVFTSSDCSEYCLNSKCARQHDANACLACVTSQNVVTAKQSDGLYACTKISYTVSLSLSSNGKAVTSSLNRCLGASVTATVQPIEKTGVTTYSFTMSYGTTSDIPAPILSAFKAISDTKSSILNFPYMSLAQGHTINVVCTATDTSSNAQASSSLSIVVLPSSRNYCGPCQLNSRSICEKLNGMCWNNYLNASDSLKATPNCLQYMAPICYGIWNAFGYSDYQCLDFQSLLNYTEMQKRPSALNAVHDWKERARIRLYFDLPMRTSALRDCNLVLSVETMKALANKAPICSWNTHTEFQVLYTPTNRVFLSNITLRNDTLFYVYPYAQVPVQAVTFQLSTISISAFSIPAVGPSTASPSSPLTLRIDLGAFNSFVWEYSWIISYVSGCQCTSSQLAAAEAFFGQFQVKSPSFSVITIPMQYLYEGCQLKVISNSFNSLFGETVYNEITIKISYSEAASLGLSALEPITKSLKGDQKNSLDVTPQFWNATNSNSWSTSTLSLSSLSFRVFSGTSSDNIKTRGADEMKIESTLSNTYSSIKSLSLTISDGFKLYTYYNVSITTNYKEAGVTYKTYYDSFMVYLKRTPPTCAISSPGSLLDPQDSLVFNSSEQAIDAAHGESVSYIWTCDSCASLITNSACSCDIFDSYQTQRASRLTISPNTLISLTKYKLSLTITITNSNNSVSCSTSTEFRTVPSARGGLRAGTLAIAETSTSSKSQYIGAITTNMDLNNALSKAAWSLVEITLASGQQYSIWDKYFKSVLQEEFGVSFDNRRRLAETSETIPPELVPAIASQSQSYPYTVKVDSGALLDNAKYTYALKLNYSNGAKPAVSTVVVEKTNSLANGAQFTVTPSSGTELTTLFTFAFSVSVTSDDSSVSYQILRKDCESSSEYSAITPRVKNVNNLVSVLYQGNSSCANNVTLKLIVRSSEGVNSNYFQYATVSALESGLRANQIETILSILETQNSLSVYQTLTLLSQISMGVSDTNTVSRILSLLSYFDTTNINTLLSTYDPDGIIGFFEICMAVINNMLVSKATVSYDVLKTITLKIQGYSETLKGIQGRSQLIQLSLYALSNICDRNKALNKANPSIPQDIYGGITAAVNNLVELKLSEIIPGTTFEVTSSNIGISIEGRSFGASLSRPYVATVQDQSVYIPEGVALLLSNQSIVCAAYNCTLSIAAISMSFSPYPELKRHVTLNESSLRTNSLSDGRIAPETMKKLYADLKDSSTPVNSIVNTNLYSSKTIQVSFYALSYSLASSERILLNTNIGLGALPAGKEIASEIALAKTAMESAYSPRIPLYYQHSSSSWANDQCYLDTSFNYLDQGSSLSILPDNTVSSQSTATYFTLLLRCPSYTTTTTAASSSRVALTLTIDVFLQMNEVLILTNYQSPFDSGSVELGYKTSAIYAILFGILFLTTVSSLLFFFGEKVALVRAKFDILTQYINSSLPSSRSHEPSFLGSLAQFLVSVRMSGYATNGYCDVSIPHPRPKETGLGMASPSAFFSPTPAQVKDDNGSPETFHGTSHATAKGLVENEDAIIRKIYDDVTARKLQDEQKEPEGGAPTKLPTDENTEFLVLRARTAVELDCRADLLNGSLLGLFKTGYAFLNLFFVLSWSNPRYLRTITLGAVYLGELFITGAFIDQNDSVRIADDSVHFTRVMIETCAVAIGCMVGLKLLLQFTCVEKLPKSQMTMKDLKWLSKRNITRFCVGLTIALAWIGICIWRVVIMGRDSTSIALEKWLWTYLLCAGLELLIVDLLKIALVKVLLNSLLKCLSGSAFMATSCGMIVRTIVDSIYSSFS